MFTPREDDFLFFWPSPRDEGVKGGGSGAGGGQRMPEASVPWVRRMFNFWRISRNTSCSDKHRKRFWGLKRGAKETLKKIL